MSRQPGSTVSTRSDTSGKPNPFGGFRKNTYRLEELFQHLAALVPRTPDVLSVWIRKRMDPLFREEIMVAVARTNDCRFCNFVHGQWALAEGLTEESLERIGQPGREAQDPKRGLAQDYAQALAAGDFGTVPSELEREMRKHFSKDQRRDIEAVARVMTVANRSANTLDALLSRRKGVPSGHSRLLDEMVIGAGFSLVYPVMMVVLAVMQRRSPVSVYRDFVRSQTLS
jgi:AhpD family alkylhydroperoxidase